MDEKTADEFVGAQAHGFLPVAILVPIILPFERNRVGIDTEQAALGNGDSVRVTAEI